MAAGVVVDAAHAGRAAARAPALAGGRARAAHALRAPRAPLRALRIRLRAPGHHPTAPPYTRPSAFTKIFNTLT